MSDTKPTFADLYNELREIELNLTQLMIVKDHKGLPDSARSIICHIRDRNSALLERTGQMSQVWRENEK
jgi:hypothetical protein